MKFNIIYLFTIFTNIPSILARPVSEDSQSDLSQQSWIVVDYKLPKESGRLRKVTAKSIFIAPNRSDYSAPNECADGYRIDEDGKCVTIVNISKTDVLVARIHDILGHATGPKGSFDYGDYPENLPLHLDLSLSDEDEDIDVAIDIKGPKLNEDQYYDRNNADEIRRIFQNKQYQDSNEDEAEKIVTTTDYNNKPETLETTTETSDFSTTTEENDIETTTMDYEALSQAESQVFNMAVVKNDEIASTTEESISTTLETTNPPETSPVPTLIINEGLKKPARSKFTDNRYVYHHIPTPSTVVKTNQEQEILQRLKVINDIVAENRRKVEENANKYQMPPREQENLKKLNSRFPPGVVTDIFPKRPNRQELYTTNRSPYWWLPTGWDVEVSTPAPQPMLVRFWSKMPLIKDTMEASKNRWKMPSPATTTQPFLNDQRKNSKSPGDQFYREISRDEAYKVIGLRNQRGKR